MASFPPNPKETSNQPIQENKYSLVSRDFEPIKAFPTLQEVAKYLNKDFTEVNKAFLTNKLISGCYIFEENVGEEQLLDIFIMNLSNEELE